MMTSPIPAGHEGIIPHLVVDGAAKAIEFYVAAFGAEEVMRSAAPDGRLMHAEIRLDGRMIYLNDDFPEYGDGPRHPGALGGTPVIIHRYVEDCDSAVAKAEAVGATVTMPPADMFWGDRYAVLRDPFGHQWSIATHVKDMSPQEIEQAAAAMFGGS